jgi:signal transduction histidine kinase
MLVWDVNLMSGTGSEPSYADFDDYRHNQRVVVIVRWFMLGSWAIINHWNADWNLTLLFVDLIGLGLVGLNARLHFKLRRGERISRSLAVGMSLFDVIAITGGIAITNGFENTFFILYYPSLMGLALVTESRRLSVLFVTLVAAGYSTVSIVLGPGLDTSEGDDRRLLARIMVMYALVIAANLINRAERSKRAEAVGAEQVRAAENLKLVTMSQEEKLRVAEQRMRIRREIHDGLAQSLYAISLNIESTAAMAESSGASDIGDRLVKLIPVARHALLETRHYMHDLSPMLSEEGDIISAVENLAAEFGNISDIEVDLQITDAGVSGSQNGSHEFDVEPETATQICRIIQEALANVLKHSGATNVILKMEHSLSALSVVVEDNGRGFDSESTSTGFGLDHISSRAEELNGTCEVISSEGNGTRVLISIPLEKESKA